MIRSEKVPILILKYKSERSFGSSWHCVFWHCPWIFISHCHFLTVSLYSCWSWTLERNTEDIFRFWLNFWLIKAFFIVSFQTMYHNQFVFKIEVQVSIIKLVISKLIGLEKSNFGILCIKVFEQSKKRLYEWFCINHMVNVSIKKMILCKRAEK